MRRVRKFVAGNVKVAALVVVVSCTGPVSEHDRTIELGSDPPPSARPGENVAHAATIPDATCRDAGPAMPENPSHISLRLPKVPEVRVTKISGEKYDGPFTITETNTEIIVTLYIEQGVETRVSVTPVDAEKRPLAESIDLYLTAEAKLGTTELVPGQSVGEVTFSAKDQTELRLGETFLQGPVTAEFIGGTMRDVFQGVYTAEADGVRLVEWAGCQELYSFLDGPPERRTESFAVSLKAGQKLGLFPLIEPETEAVRVFLREPTPTCVAPSEE